MEVKIGVQYAARELVVDTDTEAQEVEKHLTEALASGTPFAITDTKGRRIVVPADKVAYVELGAPKTGTVGFR
jgi:hypothetical protein